MTRRIGNFNNLAGRQVSQHCYPWQARQKQNQIVDTNFMPTANANKIMFITYAVKYYLIKVDWPYGIATNQKIISTNLKPIINSEGKNKCVKLL